MLLYVEDVAIPLRVKLFVENKYKTMPLLPSIQSQFVILYCVSEI